MTQHKSSARVQYDPLNNQALEQLYAVYKNGDLLVLEQFSIDLVNKGTGKKEKKLLIINAIKNEKTLYGKMKKAQDFILAGMGLKV